MKLEATTPPMQKISQASGGKNQKSETTSQEFSDTLNAKSETQVNAGTGRSKDTDNNTSNETRSKPVTKKHVTVFDQSEALVNEDGIATTEAIAVSVDEQDSKVNEKIATHHSIFQANQTFMERLTASNIDNPGKITIDDMRQSAGFSGKLTKAQAAALEMTMNGLPVSEFQGKGAIGSDILESLLKQKIRDSKTTEIDTELKNLAANLVARDTAAPIEQKPSDLTRILSNLTEKQIPGNTNSSINKSGIDRDFQASRVITKENIALQSGKENNIGETKIGELKAGELKSANMKAEVLQSGQLKSADVKAEATKIGELKTGESKATDVKIGEVKLERIAPSSLNQVIINTLSSAGKISPISTNVIMPGQISNHLQKTLTIQLHPENLGVVEVKISDKNGSLSISVETNTRVAEKILKAEISVLSEKLAGMGILHDEMTVRNNPGLDIMKDNSNLERNGGLHSNNAGDGHNAGEGDSTFERQLYDPKGAEGKTGDNEQIIAASGEAGNKRDGIYL